MLSYITIYVRSTLLGAEGRLISGDDNGKNKTHTHTILNEILDSQIV